MDNYIPMLEAATMARISVRDIVNSTGLYAPSLTTSSVAAAQAASLYPNPTTLQLVTSVCVTRADVDILTETRRAKKLYLK